MKKSARRDNRTSDQRYKDTINELRKLLGINDEWIPPTGPPPSPYKSIDKKRGTKSMAVEQVPSISHDDIVNLLQEMCSQWNENDQDVGIFPFVGPIFDKDNPLGDEVTEWLTDVNGENELDDVADIANPMIRWKQAIVSIFAGESKTPSRVRIDYRVYADEALFWYDQDNRALFGGDHLQSPVIVRWVSDLHGLSDGGWVVYEECKRPDKGDTK